ncbi:MAG TPA: gamma-glutamyltranspeptidase [Gammaproteobacteria bacterium]|nr:gamma-glutamyltranspeptidase [Gammaproteobacteria bacterium]
MNVKGSILKLSAVALALGLMAGCAHKGPPPVTADDVARAQSAADAAMAAATKAQNSAAAAERTANAAMNTAEDAKRAADACSERCGRMTEKVMAK